MSIGCMQIPQCPKTVLDTHAYDGLGVEEGLFNEERSVVCFIDFAEDEAAAVDVDQDREAGKLRW